MHIQIVIWFVVAILASFGIGKYVQMKREITKKEESFDEKNKELINTKKELTETENKLEQSKEQISNLNAESNKKHVHDKGLEHIRNLLSKHGCVVTVKYHGRSDYLEISKSDSTQTKKLKVKSLSNNAPVPFALTNPSSLDVDYLVICRNLSSTPQIFTSVIDKVSQIIHKDGNDNFWLQPKDYEKFDEGLDKILF